MNRPYTIGGSDIPAVMGLSRWKTPLQVYLEKLGKIDQPDLSDNEAVEWGIALEDLVAKKFEKKTGLKVRRAPQLYISKINPKFGCQVDRLIQGTDDLLEVKTASAWKEKEWLDEEIPQEYILQVNWNLGITQRQKGYIAVLIGGQKFKHKSIDFDEQLFKTQTEEAEKFLVCLADETPPIAQLGDDKLLVELFPDEVNEDLQTVETFNETIAHYMELQGQKKAIENEVSDLKAKIMQVIGDTAGVKTSQYIVRRINVKECEYTVKKEASWYPRVYKNKETNNVNG